MEEVANDLLGDLVHGAGEVSDVSTGDTSNADAAVAGEVDVVVVLEDVDLLGGETSEAEHTDLVGDVVPVASGSLLLQGINEGSAHRDDTTRHELDLLVPFFFFFN